MTYWRGILIAVLVLIAFALGVYAFGRWSDAQESRASAVRANAAANEARAETARVRAQADREREALQDQMQRERAAYAEALAGHHAPVLPPSLPLPAPLVIAPPPVLGRSLTGSSQDRFPLGFDARTGYPWAWELGADWEFRIPLGGWTVLVDPALTVGPISGSAILRIGVEKR